MAKVKFTFRWEDLTDDPTLLAVLKSEPIAEVLGERLRQHEKWGEQNFPDGTGTRGDSLAVEARKRCEWAAKSGHITFRDILDEEVQEAFAEKDPSKLRAELIQVAAVAVQWVEAIDRREGEG